MKMPNVMLNASNNATRTQINSAVLITRMLPKIMSDYLAFPAYGRKNEI